MIKALVFSLIGTALTYPVAPLGKEFNRHYSQGSDFDRRRAVFGIG